jgi:HlyD family secretion protein
MLQPRTNAANEIIPAANGDAPVATRRRPDRQLGDRVRSLSLAQLPERRIPWLAGSAWSLVLVLAAGGVWYAYSHYHGPASAAGQAPPARSASKPELVSSAVSTDGRGKQESANSRSPATTSPASKGDVALEAKGYIIPAHQILVSPKVSGMILKLNVEEGRRVTKGDVLAVVESTDYAADYERAKANARLMRERLRELENGNRPEEIQQAEAELRETEAVVPQLEAELKRTTELRRRSSATQQEFELAESKYLAQLQRAERLRFAHKLMQLGPRQERIEVAKAELAQTEADVVKAEWRLGNCTIRAPITGTILKKNAEEGNIINPIAFNGSYSLCDMADLSDLEVDLNIQERDISVVQVGQQCRVRAEAYPERIYEGRVARLMPIADRAKGAIPVRVKITVPANEEGVYLKPEMGAIVTFLNAGATAPTAVASQNPPARNPAAESTP